MTVRYSAEHLLFLRDSPLCHKPERLPPAEEWMGAPPDHNRAQNKAVSDRPRSLDNPLLDQTTRRSALSHHGLRNTTNPEDIVFAPPRMAFTSSGRGGKALENDRSKDTDSQGRLSLRGRNGSDLEGDRLRENRNSPLRRRGDSDLDEGWSMVKPRKSFGADGAERFHGRMGGNFRDDKKTLKDKEDKDVSRDATRDAARDRPTRAFDGFTRDNRDRDGGDGDGRPRNGVTRSKLDSPWHKHDSNDSPAPEKKERDRTKSWRDRDNVEPADDRGAVKSTDKRWGRDREQRVERDPEWFDEPAEANRQSHTQQDFQKWMEQMKKAKGNGNGNGVSTEGSANVVVTELPQPEVEKPSPLAPAPAPAPPPGPTAEAVSDKFFLAFGAKTSLESASPGEPKDTTTAKPKPAAKSSRFTSFFNQAQEEVRPRMEQPASVPPNMPFAPPGSLSVPVPGAHAPPPEEERQAFQQLLAKLQKQSLSATPPTPSPFAAPPPIPDAGKKSAYTSPDPFQQYGADRRDVSIGRPPPQQQTHVSEILAPKPQQQSARPEQLLQDLFGHHQRVSSHGTARPDQSRNNSNTEFLMNLMRSGPDSQQLLRMGQPQPQPQPQPQKPVQVPQLNDREPDFSPREVRPQRQMRPQPPPGFPMDDSFHSIERDSRPAQPTQILQRPPPPPGLDQMPPSWMTGGGQMPPPPPPQQQQRVSMLPPPGLAGGLNRNMPPPHMFPHNFPPVGLPPPDAMAGMPPRNMPLPPPGFFNGPPHGFIPPGLGSFNGPPGPADSHVFGGSPFESRGIPPTGNGRGNGFGRL